MTIQRALETRAADGSVVTAWAAFATIWGYLEAFEGNETVVGPGVSATANCKIVTRDLAGVAPKMQVLFGTREFDIVSVVPFRQGQMRLLRLVCFEEV